MKKAIYLFIVAISIIGCVQTELVEFDRIVIEPSIDSVVLFPGETFEIDAIFINEQNEAEDIIFEWTTVDTLVATVASTGKIITAQAPGTTGLTIAARGISNSSLEIVVVPDPAAAVEVEIIPPESSQGGNGLVVGDVKALTVVATNGNGNAIEDPVIEWTSDNPAVATVNQSGEVTGISSGSVNILAAKDGAESGNFLINVVSSANEVSSLIILNDDNLLAINETGTIDVEASTAVGNPVSTDTLSLIFNSSNPEVLSIDDNGVFNTLSQGTTNVTVSLSGSTISSNTFSITVVDPSLATNITINAPSNIVTVQEILQLSFTATNGFSNSITPEVTWTSSNENIARVDQTGLVSGLEEGIATITVTTSNNVSASIAIMVEGSNSRVASFRGTNGYSASGTAMLVRRGNEIFLELGSDFMVQNGPGLFLYLSNTSNGRTTLSQGLEVSSQRVSNGAQTHNISAINGNVTLDTFSHVVIVCVPFGGITFGFAQFP